MNRRKIRLVTPEKFDSRTAEGIKFFADEITEALNNRLLKDGKRYLVWSYKIDENTLDDVLIIVNDRFKKAGWGKVTKEINHNRYKIVVHKKGY